MKPQKLLAPLFLMMTLSTWACMPLGGDFGFEPDQPEMVAFNSCADLETFLQTQAIAKLGFQQSAFNSGTIYNAQGFTSDSLVTESGNSPIPEAPFSETNLQEDGVDEADIFKVDANYAYALHGDLLVIIEMQGQSTTDATLQIEGGLVVSETSLSGNPYEMFLHGDRVVVLTRTTHNDVALLVGAATSTPNRPSSTELLKAMVYDVTDRAKPFLEREVAIEGEYLSSRRMGDQLYVVSKSLFTGPSYDSPISGDSSWRYAQQLLIGSAGMDSWLPYHYDISHGTDGVVNAASVNSVNCTATFSSKATNGDQALAIYSFDISNKKSEVKNTTILGDGAVVYASQESIIVALTNYGQLVYGDDTSSNDTSLLTDIDFFDDDEFGFGDFDDFEEEEEVEDTSLNDPSGRELTYLHRFELGQDGQVNYHATGSVEGWILNQFSLSEYQGYVRVATMVDRGGWDARSMVHVLKPTSKSTALNAPLGNNAEFLSRVGLVDNIGEGQDLYATRFKGDVGYLVTFREWDPLHVIDLRTPEAPVERGELEIPGFSTYLHPIENQQLLAIGRTSEDGGIKLSHFDVSDLDDPRVIDEENYGMWGGDSEALTEHKAFRYVNDLKMLFVPMDLGDERGLYAIGVNESAGFSFSTRIDHEAMTTDFDSGMIRRAYRIGDYLFAYSGAGVSISDIHSLETVATVDLQDI